MSRSASATARASVPAASWLSRTVTAGMPTPELGQRGREIDDAEGLDRADVQPAVQDAADSGDRVAAVLHSGQRAPGGRQQGLAGGGERHLAVVAHEEGVAEFVFEGCDGGAQAGLADVHAGRSPGEVPLLGHRHELLQLPELHASTYRCTEAEHLLDR